MYINLLEQYIETGNYHDLELLLQKEPSILSEKTSHHISPLLLACYYNKPNIIKTILKYTNTITLHEACAAGLNKHVQMMLEHKPEVINEFSTNGFTALGIASHFNHTDIVRLLLLHRADPNIASQNNFHIYPLHTSLINNHSEISKLLIEAGSEINILQKDNITPLHLAAQVGNIDMIIVLLEQGADITIKCKNGLTPADFANKKGFKEIAEILKSN